MALRRELIARQHLPVLVRRLECIIHLMARSIQRNIPGAGRDALRAGSRRVSVNRHDPTKLIGVRDPLGVRPLVLGQDRR